MGTLFWWVKIILIGLFSVYFFIFGIEVLIGSYGIGHPQMFLLYFFSASFMILISMIGILYPILQLYTYMKPKAKVSTNE